MAAAIISDGVWIAIIGLIGTSIGVIGTVMAAKLQANAQRRSNQKDGSKIQHKVAGELIAADELRILRALVDEPEGRYLGSYKTHYGIALQRLIEKRWIQRLEGKYRLTKKGEEISRSYLTDLVRTTE